jgi:hypothetical protein
MSNTTWPPVPLSSARRQPPAIDTIAVGTDGSTAAVEQARTILDNSCAQAYAPQTTSEYQTNNSQKPNSYKQPANVVILTSLPVAGCSLAVSVAGGLADANAPALGDAPTAGSPVLPAHPRWTRCVPRRRRVHLSIARPNHRTRNRPQRLNTHDHSLTAQIELNPRGHAP